MKAKHLVGIIAGGLVTLVVTSYVGDRLGHERGTLENRPFKAYYLDVNGDGMKDIVVRTSAYRVFGPDIFPPKNFIFLQDAESGLYSKLENVLKTERGLYETRIEDMTRSVDDKIKNFEAEHKVK